MAGSFSMTLANKASVVAKLAGYRAGLSIKGHKLEREVAKEIAEVARDLVPVDSGKTQDSIRAEARDGAWAAIADRNGDHPDVPIYLEFGTRNMAAQPFMVPAADLVLASSGITKVTRSIGGLIT